MEGAGILGRFLAGKLKGVAFPSRRSVPGSGAAPAAADFLASVIGRPAREVSESLELIRSGHAYGILDIPKRAGGSRRIHPPTDVVKVVQRAILDRILHQIPVHLVAHGFCRNRDILTNAQEHVRARALLNLDLQDAFPSVKEHRVRIALERHVRRLVRAQLGKSGTPALASEMLETLVTLTTHEGCLPQGAPTSPAILNIVCVALDRRLFTLGSKHGLKVTRYADDITVSSTADEIPGPVRAEIRSEISAAGWRVNERKVKYLQRSTGNALEVTGLLIQEDGRMSIAPDRRREYRAYLNEQLRLGTVSAEQRPKVEGVIAFVRRIYGHAIPSMLWKPILLLEKRLAQAPRTPSNEGRRARFDPYSRFPGNE